MPAGEGDERFVKLASGEIDLEYAFEQHRKFAERNTREDLPANARVRAAAAAENNIVSFHRFAADIDLNALQADITDVVLRTGIRAAGDMDVDRMIELDALPSV